MIPLLQKHNPQKQIGICEEKNGKFIITLNEGIAAGDLLNLAIGRVEVLDYKSEKDLIVKKFAIKHFNLDVRK